MLEFFISLIGTIFQGKEYVDNYKVRKSEAESALLEAFRFTKKHISETRNDYEDAESKELSQKWANVANKIRPFNEDTANILEMKADYWLNPEGFKKDIQDGKTRFDYRFRLIEIEKLIQNKK